MRFHTTMEPQVDPAAAALVASILGKPVYSHHQQQFSQQSEIGQGRQSLVEGLNSSFNSRNSRNSRSVSFASINSRNSLLEGFPSNSINTPSSLPPPITITPIPIPASPSPSAPALSTPAPCTPAATLQTCPISNPIPSTTTTFYSTSTKSNSSASLTLHCWNPPPPFFRYNDLQPTPLSEPRALVLLFHGLGGHAQFPTVRYLAELLAGPTANCVVYGLDLEGHGMSGGKRGFVRSANSCIEDGMQAARLAVRAGQGQGTVRDLPFFIAGTSMGAAIALNVAHRLSISTDASIAVMGVLSLAPMISVKIPKWQQGLVRTVSKIAPSVSLLPGYSSKNSSRNNSRKNVFKEEDNTQDQPSPPSQSASQSPNDEALAGCAFRDPKRRAECLADTLSYSGSLRSASAHACIKLTKKIKEITSLLSPQIPQLLLLAGDDCVVDNQSSIDYYSSCPSLDKTLKIYEGALHGLMCEPLPLRQEIEGDIVTWIVERSENFRKSRKTGVPAKSQEMRAAFLKDLENALEILEDDSDDEEEEFSSSYHEEGDGYDACFYNNY